VQSILHRNLVSRCPAADLFGHKGRAWLAEQSCRPTSVERPRRFRGSSTSTARS